VLEQGTLDRWVPRLRRKVTTQLAKSRSQTVRFGTVACSPQCNTYSGSHACRKRNFTKRDTVSESVN